MKKTVLFVLCLLLSCGVRAAPFSNLFVFGDSVSDSGNAFIASGGAGPVSPPYFAGRASNGPVYAEYVAAQIGVPLAPSLAGGTNFAVGTARTDSSSIAPQFDFFGQIGSFRSRFPAADPNALYLIFIGGNNMRDAIGAAAANPSDALRIGPAAVANAVGDIAEGIGSLIGAGARSFLVLNLPDLSLTPGVFEAGNPLISNFARATSSAFNSALDAALAVFGGVDITRFDTFALFESIRANPSAFGFANINNRCYTGSETRFDGTVCVDPDRFLWWDGLHPSARAHALLGATIAARVGVPEPTVLALLIAGAAGIGVGRKRAALR